MSIVSIHFIPAFFDEFFLFLCLKLLMVVQKGKGKPVFREIYVLYFVLIISKYQAIIAIFNLFSLFFHSLSETS